MLSEQWKLAGVKIGTTIIGQITSQEVSDDIRELLVADSGSNYIRDAAVDVEDCRIRFTTNAIKTALALIPITGLSITGNNVVAYFAKITSEGTLDLTACKTITIAKGITVLRTLSGSDGSAAAVSIECVGISADGTTSPFASGTAQTLTPATTAELYMCGGSTGISDISVDFGISVDLKRGDGTPYYTFAGIGSNAGNQAAIAPTVDYTQTTWTAPGAVTNITTVTFVQVAVATGYRGVAPITLTFAKSMSNTTRMSPENRIRCRPLWNGTNAPIVFGGLT